MNKDLIFRNTNNELGNECGGGEGNRERLREGAGRTRRLRWWWWGSMEKRRKRGSEEMRGRCEGMRDFTSRHAITRWKPKVKEID